MSARMMFHPTRRSERGECLPPHPETSWCAVIGCIPMCPQPENQQNPAHVNDGSLSGALEANEKQTQIIHEELKSHSDTPEVKNEHTI